jgi:poly(ADP-ribose) glycohydrolase ARH3
MTSRHAPASSYSRLAGAALGTMCGDALGMPVEGWSAAEIESRYGRLDHFIKGRLPAGSYTDDSQMMLAILDTLAQRGGLDPAFLAGRFAAGYQPWRGYGGRVHQIMRQLAQGAAWDQVATDSWGNGGAMRVGVLGVVYAHDEQACLRAALDQCRITHTHARALAGAAAQALAVGLAARLGAQEKQADCAPFMAHVASLVEPIDAHTAARLRAMPRLARGDETLAREVLTREYACDVSASEAVPPALGAFLAAKSAEQAIVLAVSLGGDSDTIGAMTGALAGAHWGLEALPAAWVEGLENQEAGRGHALDLCRRICGENG